MRPIQDEILLEEEWEKSLNVLLSEDCLRITRDSIFPGNNTKLFSILHNVILPFIDVAYIMCNLLFEVRILDYYPMTNERQCTLNVLVRLL